ncbi:CPBP family intramembrane glutamic endopeptidase [Phenylobacterium sp.]|uniref:CPBP family intramembrane glutamic endopeptidase n=1 Tax=Phenylobacterium sp. TaxID=1871053 RepID=UPI0035B21D42
MFARRLDGRAAAYAVAYLGLWAAATAYLAAKGADWTFPIASLAVFGAVLTAAAWGLTRNARPQPIRVERPGLELGAVLVFLAIYAVAFLGWGMSAVREGVAVGRGQEVAVLVLKLFVHVALPATLLAALGAQLRPLFGAGANRPGFWPPLVVLGAALMGLMAVVSPALKEIGETHVTALALAWATPACFLWLALEAGLCEEFLFRAVLQTRLAAALRSQTGAVVIGAVLFALAHAPGLYLRGDPSVDGYSTDPMQVAAFTVATLSPIAILFGVLWARTRSLLLVVLLHAAADLLPNLAEFLRTWA